jgi:hypothetical protein
MVSNRALSKSEGGLIVAEETRNTRKDVEVVEELTAGDGFP